VGWNGFLCGWEGSLTGEQKIRCEGGFVSGMRIAMHILAWRLTYIHKRKRSMQQPERPIDGSIEPRMVSSRAKSDEVLLVPDVLLFRIMQRVVVLDIVPNTAVLGLRRPARRKKLLCRVQECSYQRSSEL
jgi:hypothetical protein